MVFGKKRTRGKVEFDTDSRIRAILERKKDLEILRKEEKARLDAEKVQKEIREIKGRKPTKFKKFVAGASRVGGFVTRVAAPKVKTKVTIKRRKRRTTRRPVRKRTTTRRRTTARRPIRRRRKTIRRRTTTKREPRKLNTNLPVEVRNLI